MLAVYVASVMIIKFALGFLELEHVGAKFLPVCLLHSKLLKKIDYTFNIHKCHRHNWDPWFQVSYFGRI